MSESTVELSHARIGESGPALFVLHGLFGSGTNWRSIARGLADCRSVYLLDARNHGTSAHAEQMSYAAMAADVEAFMAAHAIDTADFIGHSMGGKTAMHLALHRPQRISRLLIVDIAPTPSPSDHLPMIDALLALPLERFKRRSDADKALAEHVTEAGLRAFLLQNMSATADGFKWRINLPVLRERMPALLEFATQAATPFSGPALFVRGENSAYITDEHASLISELFPAAHTISVPGAGHWVHAEQPAAFLHIAREFLQCPRSSSP